MSAADDVRDGRHGVEWVRRRRRLKAAVGIARIELVCAPSVWSAMLTRCARRYGTAHFAEGMQQLADAGLVRVELSGLELSELMDVAARRGRWWSREDSPGRAMCRAVYGAAAAIVDEVGPGRLGAVTIPPIALCAGAHP
ncbi:hypothetical protein OG413_41080 [Streptomyces sp. NBC_01433]|uniref:hypothetical protein n=1 Tax=Streptomyces sp. NBC_01433 TaxID=2903864 RepID=UPI002257F630|nr:hypothetical protein [Streptomyces sp. NBC_01433]MCX4681598.1 hypothetical protein [Streptomyces sp. NBC_01433]